MAKQKVLVVLGPTASGKSDLAVRLAKKFNGEIISADSRQVYKGLNIGTGKIAKREMLGIPHHLLNVVNPRKQFNVLDYKKLAEKALQYIFANFKLPIVVGGTGFYIDALTNTLSLPEVPPNPLLRKKLAKKNLDELYELLKQKDPKRARTIDQHNKVRLVRALEIIDKIDAVPPHGNPTPKYKFVYIGLRPANLDKRIRKRLEKRLVGIIKECRQLLKQKILTHHRMYELGLEYRYTAMYLEGKLSRKELAEKLYIEIRHYAKRQMTWFSAKGAAPAGFGGQGSASPEGGKRYARNKQIMWFRPEEYKQIERYVRMAMLGLPRAKSRGD